MKTLITDDCPACRGRGVVLDTLPNSTACPICPMCQGSGLFTAEDPTKAGSGSPAGFQPALRSLSALAKLHEEIARIGTEAHDERAALKNGHRRKFRTWYDGYIGGLAKCLDLIERAQQEEPEANTERTHGGPTHE